MKETGTVMACVDLSDYSPMTLDYARAIATGGGLKLVVLSVVQRRDVQPVYMVELVSPYRVDTEEELVQLKSSREAEVWDLINTGSGTSAEQPAIRIELGQPADRIIAMAESLAPDLVVMANKGRSNLSRFMFGSAAEKVFRCCPVPLLSVRDKAIFRRKDGVSDRSGTVPKAGSIRSVLAAVDFSSWTTEVLAQAGWLARITGAKLSVFNCINQKELDWVREHYTPPGGYSLSRFLDSEIERRNSLLPVLMMEAGLDRGVETIIDSGIPFEKILGNVDELGADVLVIGPRGSSQPGRFIFGSTAEKLFRHCPVPVLRLGPEFIKK